MGEEPEKMYSITEAAQHLGVSRNTIKAATRQNRLPSTLQHGIHLIRASDLEAYRARTQPGGVKRVGRPRKRAGQDEPPAEGQTPQ